MVKEKDIWSAFEVQNDNSAIVSDGLQSEPVADNGSTSNGTPFKSSDGEGMESNDTEQVGAEVGNGTKVVNQGHLECHSWGASVGVSDVDDAAYREVSQGELLDEVRWALKEGRTVRVLPASLARFSENCLQILGILINFV